MDSMTSIILYPPIEIGGFKMIDVLRGCLNETIESNYLQANNVYRFQKTPNNEG
jgi:hypothetical protein